jgi:hypothetical protein
MMGTSINIKRNVLVAALIGGSRAPVDFSVMTPRSFSHKSKRDLNDFEDSGEILFTGAGAHFQTQESS